MGGIIGMGSAGGPPAPFGDPPNGTAGIGGGEGKPGGGGIAGPGRAPIGAAGIFGGVGKFGGSGGAPGGAGVFVGATCAKVELCGKMMVSFPEARSTMLIGSGLFLAASSMRSWLSLRVTRSSIVVPRIVSVALRVPSKEVVLSAAEV